MYSLSSFLYYKPNALQQVQDFFDCRVVIKIKQNKEKNKISLPSIDM